jgi:hypothetical protein
MEQSLCREVDNLPTCQYISYIFWNKVFFFPYSMFRESDSETYPKPHEASPHFITLRSFLILYSHLRLGLPSSLHFNVPHLSHVCYIPGLSHHSWLHRPNVWVPVIVAERFMVPRIWTSRTLGLWVRILLEAWFMSVFFCFVLSSTSRGLEMGWSSVQRILSYFQKFILNSKRPEGLIRETNNNKIWWGV